MVKRIAVLVRFNVPLVELGLVFNWQRQNIGDNMGLVISHDCYQGSYSQWFEFIKQLARTINICLPLMEGFYKPLETIMDRKEKQILATLIVQEMIRTVQIPLLPYKWEWYPIDPLHELFMPPNNRLPKEHHIILANRLNRLLYENESLMMFDPARLNSWQIQLASQLIVGLRLASSKDEDVIIGE